MEHYIYTRRKACANRDGVGEMSYDGSLGTSVVIHFLGVCVCVHRSV